MLQRAADPADGRSSLVSVTDEGRALMAELRGRKDAYLAAPAGRARPRRPRDPRPRRRDARAPARRGAPRERGPPAHWPPSRSRTTAGTSPARSSRSPATGCRSSPRCGSSSSSPLRHRRRPDRRAAVPPDPPGRRVGRPARRPAPQAPRCSVTQTLMAIPALALLALRVGGVAPSGWSSRSCSPAAACSPSTTPRARPSSSRSSAPTASSTPSRSTRSSSTPRASSARPPPAR